MAAAMALMESPAIILANKARESAHPENHHKTSLSETLHESFTD